MNVKALVLDNSRPILFEAMLCLAASFLLTLSAQVCFVLPFSLVPFTLHTMALSFLAYTLGSRLACMAVLTYLGQAICGLPVLANGKGGLLPFIGPTAGYLAGFLIASYAVGRLFEMSPNCNRLKAFAIFSLGSILLLACGWAWLSVLVGPFNAFMSGVVPFVCNDLLKNLMLVSALPLLKRIKSSTSGFKQTSNRM